MTTAVAPRISARATSCRTSAEPTPWPRKASATTTPISVATEPPGPPRSPAMAWPMIIPLPVVATSTSVWAAPPARMRSMAPLVGGAPEKNLR